MKKTGTKYGEILNIIVIILTFIVIESRSVIFKKRSIVNRVVFLFNLIDLI